MYNIFQLHWSNIEEANFWMEWWLGTCKNVTHNWIGKSMEMCGKISMLTFTFTFLQTCQLFYSYRVHSFRWRPSPDRRWTRRTRSPRRTRRATSSVSTRSSRGTTARSSRGIGSTGLVSIFYLQCCRSFLLKYFYGNIFTVFI